MPHCILKLFHINLDFWNQGNDNTGAGDIGGFTDDDISISSDDENMNKFVEGHFEDGVCTNFSHLHDLSSTKSDRHISLIIDDIFFTL